MTHFEQNTFSDVYKMALEKLLNDYDYLSSPRGSETREIMDATLTIKDPTQNLFGNSYRGIPMKYLKTELALYFSGRNDAEGYVKASKFWDMLKTKDNTINSAYGYLIFTKDLIDGKSQWDWAYESLSSDINSRQAVMFFNRPDYQYNGNKDFICTLNMVFHIRDNKLFARANMRSNDIRRGMQYDIPFFTILHQLMYKKLKKNVYPNLELGSYTHYAASFHLYNHVGGDEEGHDFDMAEKMLAADWTSFGTPVPEDDSIIMNPILNKILNREEFELDETDPNYEFYKWLKI